MKSKSGLWRKMLYAARDIVEDGGRITSATLADEMEIEVKVASAWLSHLAGWGYIRRIGKETISGRWAWVWELTRFGIEYKPAREKKVSRELKIAANPKKKGEK